MTETTIDSTPRPATPAPAPKAPTAAQEKAAKESKNAGFKKVRAALAEMLKRDDLTPQEHYDLNTPYQALGAHEGPKG